MTTSRGIRNNNPGNIRHAGDKWQGMRAEQEDKEFVQFETPVYGIRALARLLIRYYDHYDLKTLDGIITRWAPPVENNTLAYVRAVGKVTGFGPAMSLDLHKFAHLEPLVRAIIQHENGSQPYSESQITKGLVLAGVEPEKKSIKASTTAKAATVAATATVASPILEAAKVAGEHAGLIQQVLNASPAILAVVAFVAIGWILYDRISDRKKGLR